MVDFILSRDVATRVSYCKDCLEGLTDHTLLHTHIPMKLANMVPSK